MNRLLCVDKVGVLSGNTLIILTTWVAIKIVQCAVSFLVGKTVDYVMNRHYLKKKIYCLQKIQNIVFI